MESSLESRRRKRERSHGDLFGPPTLKRSNSDGALGCEIRSTLASVSRTTTQKFDQSERSVCFGDGEGSGSTALLLRVRVNGVVTNCEAGCS